ncbi:MAG: hypothetical protein IH865_00060 [Chloroflexi bacterium]|nr:hypothetical protein [Chloroflexota bacterium]
MAEETAAPPTEMPEELVETAKAAAWPEDLVMELLSQGAEPSDLMRYMTSGVTAEQVRQFMASQGGDQGGGGMELTLAWMNVPTEWGIRAKPTKHGLTIDAINVGKYGEVPDVWKYNTEMPRGAVPITGVEAMGYTIFEKQELWADNAGALYEEAIQRRWGSATDIDWENIKELPDDLERAICQICTHFSEKAQLEADILAGWEPELSYGYHEIKLYLSTVIFEGARHAELFRKRALSNGGGLGLQSTGWGFRSVTDSRNFTEAVSIQMVLQDSFTLTQYQYCERYAPSAPEKRMFRMAMQDKARHVAYGLAHLKYVLLHRPERRGEMEKYLDKGESLLVADDKDTATREAFAILFGGSQEKIQEGLQKYEKMRERQVRQYLARLRWATLEREETIFPALRKYVQGQDEAAAAPSTAARMAAVRPV